jgi:hypothetical protein
MLTGLLLVAILVMKLFPETPFARALHRALVAGPLERLAAMDRRHALFALAVIALALFASDMIALIGSADLAFAIAWDVSVYVDALAVAWTLAAIGRSKGAWLAVKARFGPPRGRSIRRPMPRRRRSATQPAANDSADDGDAGRRALAA